MGVGDFGEDGDFCGEEAIVETRIGLDSIRDCLCAEPSEVHRKQSPVTGSGLLSKGDKKTAKWVL